MANSRTTQLQNIAGKLPVANQRVAQGLQQANEAQLRGSIATAKAGPRTAQQMGAQQTEVQTKTDLAAQTNTLTQGQQIAQQNIQNMQQETQVKLMEKSNSTAKLNMQLQNQLAQMDRETKKEIFDANMEFKKDELGRTTWNERQLLDWKLSQAITDEEFATYEQQARQVSRRKIEMLNHAAALLEQELKASFESEQAELDYESQKKVQQAIQKLKKEAQEEQNKSAKRAAMFTTVGTVAGAVIGGIYGGPGGAAIGASVGGAAGGAVGSATE